MSRVENVSVELGQSARNRIVGLVTTLGVEIEDLRLRDITLAIGEVVVNPDKAGDKSVLVSAEICESELVVQIQADSYRNSTVREAICRCLETMPLKPTEEELQGNLKNMRESCRGMLIAKELSKAMTLSADGTLMLIFDQLSGITPAMPV